MIKKIKNNDSVIHTWHGQEIQPGEYYTILNTESIVWANDSALLEAIISKIAIVNDGTEDILDTNNAINYLKSDIPINTNTRVESITPFAEPTHRSKFNATPTIATIAPNDSGTIDLQITEDRYIYGGEGCVTNAQLGDYFTAEVVDVDEIIPEAYRAALCENWPVVSKYVDKMWIVKESDSTHTEMKLNTYPLVAKISAGLYLRVTYYAIDAGTSRQIVFNYYLTKKL